MAFRPPCSTRAFGVVLASILALTLSACGRFGFEPIEGLEQASGRMPNTEGADAATPEGTPTSEDSGAATSPLDADESLGQGSDDAGPSEVHSDAQIADDPLTPSLIHHYTFEGTGTVVTDVVGHADGTVVDASLDGQGAVSLSGGLAGPHVSLPAGLISSLTNLSIEMWLTWNGGIGYQRVFDFGNSSGGAGAQGSGTSHFSLALNSGRDVVRLVFDMDPTTGSDGWRTAGGTPVISVAQVHQLVAVFDRPANEIRLYVDGVRVGSAGIPAEEGLSGIDDVNCWLGMGQWGGDPNLDGTLHDARIYDTPLSDEEVSLRFARGYE